MKPYEYDDQNIFAKILRGELPCRKVHETEYSLAFADIHPKAPVHVLLIPKGRYVSFDHFALDASQVEIEDFVRTLGEVARKQKVTERDGGAGYRLIANCGEHGMQEVPHMHVHLLAGESIGPLRAG